MGDGLIAGAATWLFRRWQTAVDRHRGRTLLVASIAVGVVWSVSSLRRHWSLGTNSFDLGIYTNGLWNLTHGYGYVSSLKGGMHLFGDHQTPTYWLIAPLFSLWPQPELLLVLQAIGYAATGAALAVLASQYGGRTWWGTAALPLLYWTYLPARNANAFDARPDSFMVPLFCWAIAGLQAGTTAARAAGALAMLLAIGCKESAAMIACVIGVAWILGAAPPETRRITRRIGIGVAALGALAFYFDTAVVPRLVGASYAYDDLYSHFGARGVDLALAPINHAREFWRQLSQPAALSYLFWTLAPLGFIPALDWVAWLVAGPAYLALFLVNTPQRINLDYQYSNEISVGLFWAGARMLPLLSGKLPPGTLQIWIAAWAIAASGGSDLLRLRHYSPTFHAGWIRDELVPAIGPELPLAASDALVPHLATRHWIGTLAMRQGPEGAPVACIVTDSGVNDRWLDAAAVEAVAPAALAQGYRLEFVCGGVQVLSLPNQPCLVRPLKCPIG